MIRVFKEVEKKLEEKVVTIDEIKTVDKKTWIDITEPNLEILHEVAKLTGLPLDMLNTSLDEEETAHVDIDEDDTLIVLDTPYVEDAALSKYSTAPLVIVYNKDFFVTVSSREFGLVNEVIKKTKKVEPHKHVRLSIYFLNRLFNLYISYLKKIDVLRRSTEKELKHSMKNKELFGLMEINKSLVYFSTALNGNKGVLLKLFRLEKYRRYEDDFDLMEDSQIEMNQAIEMCSIYTNIIATMMDTYGSVISNNLNVVMKVLAIITIVIEIPTLVASLYGMNVDVPGASDDPYLFWIIIAISAVLAIISSVVLMFITNKTKK
jgi:magnesium transporter